MWRKGAKITGCSRRGGGDCNNPETFGSFFNLFISGKPAAYFAGEVLLFEKSPENEPITSEGLHFPYKKEWFHFRIEFQLHKHKHLLVAILRYKFHPTLIFHRKD